MPLKSIKKEEAMPLPRQVPRTIVTAPTIERDVDPGTVGTPGTDAVKLFP